MKIRASSGAEFYLSDEEYPGELNFALHVKSLAEVMEEMGDPF